ncbi:MAG: type I 3-dehydroquinate dehydratase [Ruminococcaceae bacterium]|nr:type I 3-dehydroquinate dehydratase [Oscillospiraceae bacterium]
MKQKISELPSPVIAGVVNQRTQAGVISEIKNCIFAGASIIDLHLEWLAHLEEQELKKIMDSSRLPVLALHYPKTIDEENAEQAEKLRTERLLQAVQAGAAGLDMQGYTFHLPSKSGFYGEDRYSFTKGNPKEVVTDAAVIGKQCDLIERVHAMGKEVLLSCHPGIPMCCDQVVDLALFLEQRHPDIIKIVTVAKTEEDLYESIRTMTVLKKELHTPVTYHATGSAGGLSRIVNPLLGGHIAFCVDRYEEQTFIGQPQIRAMREIVDNVERNL